MSDLRDQIGHRSTRLFRVEISCPLPERRPHLAADHHLDLLQWSIRNPVFADMVPSVSDGVATVVCEVATNRLRFAVERAELYLHHFLLSAAVQMPEASSENLNCRLPQPVHLTVTEIMEEQR